MRRCSNQRIWRIAEKNYIFKKENCKQMAAMFTQSADVNIWKIEIYQVNNTLLSRIMGHHDSLNFSLISIHRPGLRPSAEFSSFHCVKVEEMINTRLLLTHTSVNYSTVYYDKPIAKGLMIAYERHFWAYRICQIHSETWRSYRTAGLAPDAADIRSPSVPFLHSKEILTAKWANNVRRCPKLRNDKLKY